MHLLVAGRSDICVADIVKLTKANSSKWLNEMPGRKSKFGWQPGYAAYTVSLSSLPKVKTYIQKQEEHHRKHTYAEECDKFLAMYEEEMRKFAELLEAE